MWKLGLKFCIKCSKLCQFCLLKKRTLVSVDSARRGERCSRDSASMSEVAVCESARPHHFQWVGLNKKWQTLNSTFLTQSFSGWLQSCLQFRVTLPFHPVGGSPCMMWIINAGNNMSQDTAVCLQCPLLLLWLRLTASLTTALSFRSNVNYIPPPQEVSCPPLFFFFFYSSRVEC